MDHERPSGPPRWSSRPGAARLLRALAFIVPFGASVVFVWAVSRVVAAPENTIGFVCWWLVLSAAGSAVMFAADRVARRMLPLAALLQLSLVFPDQAPSRFRAALSAGRVGTLQERRELLGRAGRAETAVESAELLLTLVAALSVHDRITRGHSERVRAYSVMIGGELGLSEAELDQLNWAALLHDVGKLQVAGEILNKPGRPTDEEWKQLQRHPLHGERLVEPMRGWLGTWIDAVGFHHERWDGRGYPRGVAGEDIPLPGRIVAVADVFDVITSARSYKDPASPAAGREEIARCAGSQFDPRIVRAFLSVSLGRMRLVMGPLSWLAHLPIIGRLPLAPLANSAVGAIGVVVATTATGLAGTVPAKHDAAAHASVAQAPRELVAKGPAPSELRRRAASGAAAPLRTTITARPQDEEPSPAAPEPRRDAARPAEAPAEKTFAQDPAPDDPASPPAAPPVLPAARVPSLPPLTPVPAEAPPEPAAEPVPAPADDPPLEAAPAPSPPEPPPPVADVNDPPSFTAGGDQTIREDAGAQTAAGWASGISPGAPDESAQTVGFTLSSDRPDLFSVPPAVSPTGTLTYTPAPDAFGTATVTVRAIDDGGTADGGADTSAPHTFAIVVTPVNDAPSYTGGADQAVAEDAGPRTVPGWASALSPGAPGEGGQTISFSVSAVNPGLFSTAPAVSPGGTLTYTPAPDASGTATLTVRAVDDGGTADGGADTSAPQTATITIAPVNDAPTFSAGPSQTTFINSSRRTIPGWATGLSAGPADETGQGLSFVVTTDRPDLFAEQPDVLSDGTLVYRPAVLALGTATVTVTLVDTGGVANGGSDTSSPRTFTITVIL